MGRIRVAIAGIRKLRQRPRAGDRVLPGCGFGNAPLEIELRLSVHDSPNSAGVVINALRCTKLGLERSLVGPLEATSACFMKSPPRQMRDEAARRALEAFIADAGAGPRAGGELRAGETAGADESP